MTSISLLARTAMVFGGWPSSQRKRLGSANQTWPVAVSGCVKDFKARVWMKSADQVWMLVCEPSQEARGELVSAAGAVKAQAPTMRNEAPSTKHQAPEKHQAPSFKIRVASTGWLGRRPFG